MTVLHALVQQGDKVDQHQPYSRIVVDEATWSAMAGDLSRGQYTLLGLWGESRAVHLAVWSNTARGIAVLTYECPGGEFPSIAKVHPPAIRLERAIHDLFGLRPVDLPDGRPWLDHQRWGVTHPLGKPARRSGVPESYSFLPVKGEGLHQIPVGPVHAGIIEPGHFRFTANGETVVRLEERLGYVHKGIDGLMRGASLAGATSLAGRISGDSTVAYSFAFALAVEAALGVTVPARALWLRALMAELERLANHFGDIGAICNDAAFSLIHAHCGVLRELTLRAADAAFGHRLMMDQIVPGGVAGDLRVDGASAIRTLIDRVNRRFPTLVERYDNTPSLQDRTVGTGILRPVLAEQFGAGGYVGRASGRAFDARRTLAYAPYDALTFEVPVFEKGDVDARIWVRIREVEQSIKLIEQILKRLPAGPVRTETPTQAGEGLGLVEGFRGDVLVWLRLDAHGRVDRCHLRDPSWFQWPLLEAVIEGNIVADFPLCNKSFNCSYSGHDL